MAFACQSGGYMRESGQNTDTREWSMVYFKQANSQLEEFKDIVHLLVEWDKYASICSLPVLSDG